MKRSLSALFCFCVLILFTGCSSSHSSSSTPVIVNVSGVFTNVSAGGAPITLTATVIGDTRNAGVTWMISVNNGPCTPSCGTLKTSTGAGTASLTATYTPPAALPLNNTATITATSVFDRKQVFVFNFQIVPPLSLSIAPKFTTQTAGGPAVTITATITNDFANAGVTWTLTAGGASCSPGCGTLTPAAAPALTAQYQPPTTPPTGAAASPTITATSVTASSVSDTFTFTITAPPIAVTILNKFTQQAIGGPAVNIAATITNDFSNAGLTWTLTAAGAACSPACGTLIAAAAPGLSASYTPPTTLPTGANASPTITAASVADATKSDSFNFSIVTAGSLFSGNYAFLLRGFDSSGAPLVLAGTIISDGNGNIAGGELDRNDNGTVVSVPSPLGGTYTIDTSFNGIPRLTINITQGNIALKCALSSDGKRAKVIQYDGTFALDAGTMLQQDPAALTAANLAGSYAFGLDSDAGTNAGVTGRIVEVGQIVIGANGASVTSGLADAGQAGASGPLFGGAQAPPAPLDAGSTGTAPDSLGRGTLTLSFAGFSTQYAYYIVNAQQLNLIEIDAGGSLLTVQSGTAQLQQPLTDTSIDATSVVALTGVNNANTASNVVIGALTLFGSGAGATSSATYDVNNGGHVSIAQTTNGVLSHAPFAPATGRAVLVNSPSIATSFVGAAALYYYDTGKAFLADVTPNNGAGAIGHGLSGMLVPQSVGPFTIAGDLSGNSIGFGGGSSKPAAPNIDFAYNLAGGSASPSTYTALIDLTTSNTAVGANGQIANIPIGSAYLLDDPAVGRGRMAFTGGIFGNFTASGADIASIYIIAPNQFVAIEQTGLGPSGILFFEAQ